MCGIFGYSGKNPPNINDLKILCLYNRPRGIDSTGIATAKLLHKDAVDPIEFLAKFEIPKANEIIGHTRRKSYNLKVSKETAHPFQFDNLVGAHNGYISNYTELSKKYNCSKEVDSFVAYYIINHKGFIETLPELIGNMAFSWIDYSDEALNLYRYGNQIHVGYKKDGVFYSSEEEPLEAINCKDIVLLHEHTHVRIKDGELIFNEKLIDSVKPERFYERHERTYEGALCDVDCETESRKKKKFPNDIMLSPEYAPEYADVHAVKGFLYYCWYDSDTLDFYLEKIESYGKSKYWKYSVLDSDDMELLRKDHPEIYKLTMEK